MRSSDLRGRRHKKPHERWVRPPVVESAHTDAGREIAIEYFKSIAEVKSLRYRKPRHGVAT
jgi:hypothetical protein